jgi:hypothetical protein
LVELKRKWNRLCHSLHQGRHSQNNMNSTLYSSNQSSIGKSYSYASSYPWWPSPNTIFPESNSISFADSALKSTHNSNLGPRLRRQQSCSTIEFNFTGSTLKHQSPEPSLGFLKDTDGKEVKITLALGNSLFSDSGKLMEKKSERTMQRADTCKLLQENVPWQSETIPSIAEALIDSKFAKQEAWLLIQGNDSIGKRRLALAIAESIFGSADFLLHINMRKRDHFEETPCSEILSRAMKNHGKLVILVEDVDLADTQFMKFLADAYETGKFGESSKREGSVGQAIFILTKGGSTSYEDYKKKQDCVIKLKLQVNETKPSLGTFSFDHKRKAEWDLLTKIKKTPRMEAMEDASSCVAIENGNASKKDFSRQSSFNTLDLNIRADEDDESEDKPGEYSPISSDLTRETTTDPQTPHGFLELIENRFVFDRSPARDREMIELFMLKIKGSFEEENVVNFSVDERVLEEVLVGSASFPNSLFEKWLKDIFQTSLQRFKVGGKEGMEIRLCLELDGKGEEGVLVLEDGFLGSCLPKKIKVSFIDY